MLYFMRKNAVHFRDDAGTTFVIAVMFPCRVVSPLQCNILLQTAEALELLQLGPSFQPRRNRQLYSYHQQMSLTAHLTLKCSDSMCILQPNLGRSPVPGQSQHLHSSMYHHEQFTPLKRGIEITIQIETDKLLTCITIHIYLRGSNKFSSWNKKLPRRWVLRFLIVHIRVAEAQSCPQMPSSAPTTRTDCSWKSSSRSWELPQFTGQPMNVNCHSFWFSLTSQAVICGNSDCVGKQLLTNN